MLVVPEMLRVPPLPAPYVAASATAAKPTADAQHRRYTSDAAIKAANPSSSAGQDQVLDSFWKQALSGEDQLRQRAVYALSVA